jgi:NAD(P)-dependent dehydrogenase (short-subunit alcohol dehydrogenase family)
MYINLLPLLLPCVNLLYCMITYLKLTKGTLSFIARVFQLSKHNPRANEPPVPIHPNPLRKRTHSGRKIANTRIVQADLTSSDSLKAAAAATSALVNGQIDHLLINGAYLSHTGGMNCTDFADKPELFLEELKKSDEANIAGPLFAINAFLPLLRKGGEKRVTYISSGVADLSETLESRVANSVPYCVSKAGGNIIIAKFAAELQDEGFTFLSIAPGAVATETLMNTSNCELPSFLCFLF